MRRRHLFILCTFILAGIALAGVMPAHAAPGEVKTTLESPAAYASGLTTDGNLLYVADWRAAVIHVLDPRNGKVARTIEAPTPKPSGLAFGDGRLYVSDDHTGWVYGLNLQTGLMEHSFEAPAPQATGLAYAEGTLFILAADKIYQVMPEDGTIVATFDGPQAQSGQLAHDGKYLWISNRIKDEIYLVDPHKGKVLGILKAPGPYAAGLAFLGGFLWNVDFQTRKLYQLVVTDEKPYTLSDTRRAHVEFQWTLINYGPGEVKNLVLDVAVPRELPQQKLLSKVNYSTTPSKTQADRWQQTCATFELGDLAAGRKATMTYGVDAELSAISFLIFPDRVGGLDQIPADIRTAYTVDADHLRINSEYIKSTVKEVVGDEKNPYWIARKLYDFVIDRLEYEMAGGWDIPEVVLKRHKGSCSEYTYSFIALCRAAGIPARYQGSVVVRSDDASIDEAFHRWAEIYLPNYGWIPVDANRGDVPGAADQARGFGQLSNRFLITTIGGGDSEYLKWGYNSLITYQATGYCKVEEERFGFFTPLAPTTTAPTGSAKEASSSKCATP